MSNETKGVIAAAASSTIFGLGFMFSRIALLAAEQWVVLAWRFVFAFLFLFLLWVFGFAKLNFKGKPWPKLLLLGLIDPVLYYMFESWGLLLTSAGFTAVMVALVPIISLLMGVVLLREYPRLMQTVWSVISVAGVVVIAMIGSSMGTVTLLGVFALIGTITLGSLLTVLSRKLAEQFTAFERTFALFALAAVYYLGSAVVQAKGDFTPLLQPLHDPKLMMTLVAMGVGASALGYLLYNYSLSYLSVARTTVFLNLTTVVSILAGVVFLHEPFTWVQTICVGVMFVGLYGVNRYAEPTPPKGAAADADKAV